MSESSTGKNTQHTQHRSWMPTTAGILDMCAGGSSLIGAAVLGFLGLAALNLPHNVGEPVPEWPFAMGFGLFFGLSMMLTVLGLLAVVGGVYALRGTQRFWPIIGAIAATLSCPPLGIPAVVLTIMSEQEFASKGVAR